jgi:secreted trypsin-like serine protease
MVGSLAPARLYGRRLAPIVLAIMAGATLAGSETDNAAAMIGGASPAAAGSGRSVVLILGSYGSSSTACTATAIGRDLLLTVAHCVQPGADYKLVASETGAAPVRLVDPATKGVSAGLGACTGDSGAPAFRDAGGNLTIIGVVSWSTGPNLGAGCGGLTGITPLVRYRAWIVDTARRLGSPLAP